MKAHADHESRASMLSDTMENGVAGRMREMACVGAVCWHLPCYILQLTTHNCKVFISNFWLRSTLYIYAIQVNVYWGSAHVLIVNSINIPEVLRALNHIDNPLYWIYFVGAFSALL